MQSCKKKKKRLLQYLVCRFPDKSKDALYRLVMSGCVRVEGSIIKNPQQYIHGTPEVAIEHQRFVSRGGEKLQTALDAWSVLVRGRIWLDAGSGTGGFTDCLLQAGAAAVHAVDVGYNVLDYTLRRDTRVYVYERTNIRNVQKLTPAPHSAVCDLSFRSLRGVVPHILRLTREGWGIALLKPQFEAAANARWGGKSFLLEKGVLRNSDERNAVIDSVCRELRRDGIHIIKQIESTVFGKHGNQERFLLVSLHDTPQNTQISAILGDNV